MTPDTTPPRTIEIVGRRHGKRASAERDMTPEEVIAYRRQKARSGPYRPLGALPSAIALLAGSRA